MRKLLLTLKWIVVSVALGTLPLFLELFIAFGTNSTANMTFVKLWVLKGDLLLVAAALSATLLGDMVFSYDDLPKKSGKYLLSRIILGISIGLIVAATAVYPFVASDRYAKARDTALGTILVQKSEDPATECLLGTMEEKLQKNRETIEVADVLNSETGSQINIRPDVLLDAYVCKDSSVGFLLAAVLLPYVTAAMAGLLVLILSEEAT